MKKLAVVLHDSGVGRGDRVGVYMNRCLESAIAVYGIMYSGAAFVPLDPYVPASRTKSLVEDCGIEVLISTPGQIREVTSLIKSGCFPKVVIGPSLEKIDFDKVIKPAFISWDEVYAFSATGKRMIRMLEQDLAYVMYTSGSTGKPKGIMHSHYSGLSYAKLSAELYGLHEKDVLANHSPLHFDISTMGYFTAPLAGAKTVIIPDAYTKMPASLVKLTESQKITIWYSVPLALIQMLNSGLLEKSDMSSLRWVLFGGEPFPVKHLRRLMNLWPRAKFSNVYGPAEVNQCTYYNLPGPPETDEPIPLGYVWENTEMRIHDNSDQRVHKGEIGELLIRTSTMMKGYWGQPELTQKSIFFAERIPGCQEAWYRTGDLVKLDENGRLLYLGRKDRQIKTRGYRVELDEVEAVLLSHPKVDQAAVFAIENGTEGYLIEALVIFRAQEIAHQDELKNYLSQSLPLYSIPQKITQTDTLPRNTAAKIDYKRLQEQGNKIPENE